MKLRTRGSFAVMNRVPVMNGTDEVGTLHIERRRAWTTGPHDYTFIPNELGTRLKLISSSATTKAGALAKAQEYRELEAAS